MPFDIDVTTPQDNMLISAFPANERNLRQTVQDLITAEHYESPGNGKHKIPRGTTAARPASPSVGNIYWDTDVGGMIICLSAGVWTAPVAVQPFIVGEIRAFGFLPSLLPSGWYACNAQPLNRVTHANLFAKISTKYGVGDGSTTFNVPDLRLRTLASVNMTNVGNPGALSADGDGEYGDFGQVYGVKKRAISIAEMPAHDHPGSTISDTNTAQTVAATSTSGGGLRATTVPHGHTLTIASQGSSTPQDLRDPQITSAFGIYSGV